jgi:hypothetical protein
MNSDADLSTDDLARRGGGQQSATGAGDGGAAGAGDAGAVPAARVNGDDGVQDDAGTAREAPAGSVPEAPAGTVQEAPAGRGGAADGAGDGRDVALLDPAEGERFRQRWNDVQARFVDDPQEAVRSADGLVAEVVQSLAQGFSDHKHGLEQAWQSGGDPETEDLRLALQRYRSFFDRLLST